MHEVFSNSQNDATVASSNRPAANLRASYLFCQEVGETLVNRGASGAMTQDQSYAGHNQPARTEGTSVWLVDLLTNDAYRTNAQNSAGQAWMKDFLTACITNAIFGVKKTARSGAVASSGSWANTPVDGLGMSTGSAGASKTFQVSGNAVAVCWLADNHVGSSGGEFEIRIDGVLVDTISTYIPFGLTHNGLRYGHAARVYEVDDGSHTVEIKTAAAKYSYFSYVAGNGDQTFMPKTYVGTGTKHAAAPDSFTGEARQIVLDHMDFLSSLGLPVKSVDTWGVIDPSIHMMPDGIHWNAAGQVAVKNAMLDAAREPQYLEWPLASGGNLFVHLDEDGVCTSYGEIP